MGSKDWIKIPKVHYFLGSNKETGALRTFQISGKTRIEALENAKQLYPKWSFT